MTTTVANTVNANPRFANENLPRNPRRSAREANELVSNNLQIVGYIVSEMIHRVPPTVTREDLSSAGNLALVLAARDYDETTGVPFARYASLRIRGSILDELRGMDWATRGARHRVRELQTATEQLTAALGRTPTRDEIALALGTTTAAVDRTRADLERRVMSLDIPESPVADRVGDTDPEPEEALLAQERLRYLKAAIDALPERLRGVVTGLYIDDRSVAEVADDLGVTQSRVSQLRTEALVLMRDGMNACLDPDQVPVNENPDGVAARRRAGYYARVAATAAGQTGRGQAAPKSDIRNTQIA
jgi:RNA polymerase sigma factor for flagellar operon FliA